MSSPPGQGPGSPALRVSEPAESSSFRAESRRSGRRGSAPTPTPTPSPRKLFSALCRREYAAAMSTAPGVEAYFHRGSLFWFTFITLSFGYYTVKSASGVMALFKIRACSRGQVAQAQFRRPQARSRGRGAWTPEDAGALIRPRLSLVPEVLRNRLLRL